MKKQADEEDRLYAMQQEALRRQQIIADRQLKRGLRNVQEEHSAIQQTQTADQRQDGLTHTMRKTWNTSM